MLRSTVTGTVVLWLAVMSTAGCTQEGSAGPRRLSGSAEHPHTLC
jgi:hypothetical protein